MHFKISSAICLNLNQSKILSSDTGIRKSDAGTWSLCFLLLLSGLVGVFDWVSVALFDWLVSGKGKALVGVRLDDFDDPTDLADLGVVALALSSDLVLCLELGLQQKKD